MRDSILDCSAPSAILFAADHRTCFCLSKPIIWLLKCTAWLLTRRWMYSLTSLQHQLLICWRVICALKLIIIAYYVLHHSFSGLTFFLLRHFVKIYQSYEFKKCWNFRRDNIISLIFILLGFSVIFWLTFKIIKFNLRYITNVFIKKNSFEDI